MPHLRTGSAGCSVKQYRRDLGAVIGLQLSLWKFAWDGAQDQARTEQQLAGLMTFRSIGKQSRLVCRTMIE